MMYTETQVIVLHWTLIVLMIVALIILFLIFRTKRIEYQKLTAWRKSLKQDSWVRVKGYENPVQIWANYGDTVVLIGDNYSKVPISDVYPYDVPSWEIEHEDEKEGKSIVGCIMLVTLISLVTIFSVIVAILI